MKPAAEILRILRSLRWRMALGDLLRSTARAALFFFGVLLVLTAAAWWRGCFRPNLADIPVVLTLPFLFGAHAALRRRIILNFEGEAEGRTSEEVTAEILRNNPT